MFRATCPTCAARERESAVAVAPAATALARSDGGGFFWHTGRGEELVAAAPSDARSCAAGERGAVSRFAVREGEAAETRAVLVARPATIPVLRLGGTYREFTRTRAVTWLSTDSSRSYPRPRLARLRPLRHKPTRNDTPLAASLARRSWDSRFQSLSRFHSLCVRFGKRSISHKTGERAAFDTSARANRFGVLLERPLATRHQSLLSPNSHARKFIPPKSIHCSRWDAGALPRPTVARRPNVQRHFFPF